MIKTIKQLSRIENVHGGWILELNKIIDHEYNYQNLQIKLATRHHHLMDQTITLYNIHDVYLKQLVKDISEDILE